MANAKEKRDCCRDKVRGKRAEIRKGCDAKRAALRKALRGAGAVVGAVGLALCLVAGLGCNTATPASKSAATKACGNTTTVNNYVGLLPSSITNGMAGGVALGGGSMQIQISDLNGTISQSADTAGGDRTDLTANPSMAAGITGDKPMEAIQKAVAAFASPQDAMSATLESLVKKFGFGAATNAIVEAGKACSDGSCSDTQ